MKKIYFIALTVAVSSLVLLTTNSCRFGYSYDGPGKKEQFSTTDNQPNIYFWVFRLYKNPRSDGKRVMLVSQNLADVKNQKLKNEPSENQPPLLKIYFSSKDKTDSTAIQHPLYYLATHYHETENLRSELILIDSADFIVRKQSESKITKITFKELLPDNNEKFINTIQL